MMPTYFSNSTGPYNVKYRSGPQRQAAQLANYGGRRIPLKENHSTVDHRQSRHIPRYWAQSEPRYYSQAVHPNQLSIGRCIKSENSRLPPYIVPVLYSPKIPNAALSKNQQLNKLYQRKSYEKICQGVPVTSVDNRRVVLNKNYRKLTHSSSLSQSETEVYSRLMRSMYGTKNTRADPRGDSAWWFDRQNKIERPTQPTNQVAAKRANRMCLEADRDYSNPNYQSESDYSSSASDVPISESKAPPVEVPVPPTECYAKDVMDTSINSVAEATPHMDSSVQAVNDKDYYQTTGYVNYGNTTMRYANYGVSEAKTGYPEAPITKRSEPPERETKPPEVSEAVTPQNITHDNKPIEKLIESKATQTSERPTSLLTKETQTPCRKISKKRSASKLRKSENKNARSEANITVIIDRGWKEDVYSIAGHPSPTDSSFQIVKSDPAPVMDLLPVLPCLQLKSPDATPVLSSTKRLTRNSAINTNISLCKKKLKSKLVEE